MFTRTEMLDLVVVDGHAKGVVMRNLKTGEITKHAADAVILATGGLWQRLLSFHQRDGLQRDGGLEGAQERGLHGEPLLHPNSPHLHPGLR